MNTLANLMNCDSGLGLTGDSHKPYIEPWEFHYELDTAPAIEPVTLAEAKLFARIDISDDDALVTALITAARKIVEEQTGRALINQTWIAWLDCQPCSYKLNLAKGRIDSVTSIKAYDEDSTAETLDSSAYIIDKDNARIGLVGSNIWPTVSRGFNSFAVEYVAGYGATADDVPEWAKTAIKQLVSHWYEYREVSSNESANEIPFGVKMILQTNSIGRI